MAKVLLFSAVIFLSSLAQAVDLANRLGVGYSDQLSESVPALTARYYPNSNTGISLAVGVNTEDGDSRFGVLGKLYRVIFTEENLNFYIGGGAGLLSTEDVNGSNRSGFELIGFVGAEFFFTGLESLGFTFETGVAVRSDSDGTLFRTVGDHPIRGGMIFYF